MTSLSAMLSATALMAMDFSLKMVLNKIILLTIIWVFSVPNSVIMGFKLSKGKHLSVFWISNVKNHIHTNAAVGGEAGFWAFGHVGKQVDRKQVSCPSERFEIWRL